MKQVFKHPDGSTYSYEMPERLIEPVSEEKLKRFESMLEALRVNWKKDPRSRWLYKRQASMIQAGIDLIRKKLSYQPRKLL